VKVKTEADDATDCPLNDEPSTGVLDFVCYIL